ncbi:hypothetical protein L195_g063413, partial [Trifolium pratense]
MEGGAMAFGAEVAEGINAVVLEVEDIDRLQ